MKKKGRLSSFRHGDNAEVFGVALLRGLCAVAEVPRQEDWGVFDAIATLLRADGRLLVAESSFLVQFKSSGTKKLHLTTTDLRTIQEQELDFIFARVDLGKGAIKLYTIGPALSRFTFNQESELTIDFDASDKEKGGGSCQNLGPPILEWTGPLLSEGFRTRAYHVLKAWLAYNKYNRLLRPLGRMEMVTWETNEIPKVDGSMARGTREPDDSAMSLVLPALHWISMRVMDDHERSGALLTLYDWARERGANVGMDDAFLVISQQRRRAKEQIVKALEANTDADFGAAIFSRIPKAEGNIAFEVWTAGSFRSFEGTLEGIAEQGFHLGPDPSTGNLTILNVTQPYLREDRIFLRLHDWVILGKRLPEALRKTR